MPNNRTVERDVARAMMYIITNNTIIDEDEYSLDIVPSKKPPKGFEAKLGAWQIVFGKVADRLGEPHEGGYKVQITAKDAKATLNKPLSDACSLLVEKIG